MALLKIGTIGAVHAALCAGALADSVWTPEFPRQASTAKVFALDLVAVDYIGSSVLIAQASFGTPAQQFHVAVDVWTNECYIVKDNQNHLPFYDHERSTSYTANGTDVTCIWCPHGFTSHDRITLGKESHGVFLDDALFVEVTDKSFHGNQEYQGSCGLGYAAGESTGAPSMMRELIQRGKLERPLVGASSGGRGSGTVHVTIGGLDTSRFTGNIEFVNVTPSRDADWRVPLGDINVGGTKIPAIQDQAVSISWGSFTSGPEEQVSAIADALGAETFVLPCDGPLSDIVLHIERVKLVLTKDTYLRKKGLICVLGIGVNIGDPNWYVGMGALPSIYTVFDYGHQRGEERVGFANAIQT